MTTMAEPHTPTCFKDPILDSDAAFSVDDEVEELFGVTQPLHKLNDVFDGLHDRTASLVAPVGTNPEIADLRQRLIDQDQKHKNVVTEIHGILDELELLQGQYVANVKKEVEREITERMDKLVQERVAERLKTHIPQELQDEVARSNRELPQDQPPSHPGSQLLDLDTGLPISPRNPPSAIHGPSTPTLLSHPPHPSALAHCTPSISDDNQLDVCTPSTPVVSSPQGLVLGQGSPGTPNRRSTSICSETEDQVAEQEQNDKMESAADKEKAEAGREAEVADEIRKLEEVAWLEKWQQEEERPAVSSPQGLVLGQGSPGTPNRRSTSICSETEDQVAEQEQNDKMEAAADKEKAEAEREVEVADGIRKLEEVAWLEKWQQEEERPAMSSPQGLVLEQGSPGTPNRRSTSICSETEDQVAEQEQNDKMEAAADKEKAEAEREVEVADEIRKLEEVAWLEKKWQQEEERPTVSSPQGLVLGQGSPGTPNRRSTSIFSETEDQVTEREQNDKVEAAADKEKADAEREAEVADEIRKLEEVAWLEKGQQEERLRKDVETLELQRLKEEEEEERRLKLKQEEEHILKAKQDAEEALRLAQQRAKEEEERTGKEEREEQERISKLAEETRLRLEEEAAVKAKAEAISEPEPEEREEAEREAHKGNRKQDGQLEDAKITSIVSPTSDKRRPGPLDDLDLTSTIRSASPVVASFAAARFIADITTVSYPEGYRSPHPNLNQNVKNGKFRYDREFLLQFMSVCKERPPALPPLDAIGLKAVDRTHAMSQSGSGLRPSGAGQASVGLGFSPALGTPGANNFFSVGNFAMMGVGYGLNSEEGYANSNRASSVSGAPTIAPLQKRVRTKHKVNRNENYFVPGGSGGQSLGSGFYSFTNQMQNLDSVVPHRAPENLWDRDAVQVDQDSPELVEQKVKFLLNELTMEKFDSISDQIIAWSNMSEKETDGRTLIQVIQLVFEKATDKAAWSEMYARLCRKMMEQISPNVQDDGIRNNEGNPITGGQLFRKYLLNQCQEDFERGWVAKEATAAPAAATKELEDETAKAAKAKIKEGGTEKIYSVEYYTAQKIRRQRLGLIKFIGELFKMQMLTERIMHECVKRFLVNNPEEEEIESLCMLLATVGSVLDIRKARGHLDVYFSQVKELMKSPNVTPRMQYMLRDLLELRERNWVARNAQQPVAFPLIIAQMKESYHRQISMSQGGLRRGGGRGEFNNSQRIGPDGWAVAGSGSGPLRPPPKAGDLLNFGMISKTQPKTFGPSSVFAGKKGAENKREAISWTNPSSNMSSMLSSQGPEAGDKDKIPAAAADPHPQRKRLVLQPRFVPVDVASPAAESESSHSEEEATIEMTDEAARKRISEDLKEFFAVRNLEEAEVYFSSLPPQHHHLLVDKIVSTAVESKEDDAKLVSQFFTLAVSKELCSAASFEEGLTPVAEIIDDIAIDTPKAFQLLAMMVKGASLNQERLFNLASKSSDRDEFLALLQ